MKWNILKAQAERAREKLFQLIIVRSDGSDKKIHDINNKKWGRKKWHDIEGCFNIIHKDEISCAVVTHRKSHLKWL